MTVTVSPCSAFFGLTVTVPPVFGTVLTAYTEPEDAPPEESPEPLPELVFTSAVRILPRPTGFTA